MYVNELTQDYGEEGRAAVRELLRRGEEIGAFTVTAAARFVGADLRGGALGDACAQLVTLATPVGKAPGPRPGGRGWVARCPPRKRVARGGPRAARPPAALPLAPDGDAAICSYECTFCLDCTDALDGVCPNCGVSSCAGRAASAAPT